MRQLTLIPLFSLLMLSASAQKPCSAPAYRQFDFWIGEWEAFGLNGQKAGDSKVSLILDSCIILEEWTSASVSQGIRYAGKSFNTWNAATKQWQQTWVDNVGGSNEYLLGKFEDNKIIYRSSPFPFNKDTMAIRKMTFTNLSPGSSGSMEKFQKIMEQAGLPNTTWNTGARNDEWKGFPDLLYEL